MIYDRLGEPIFRGDVVAVWMRTGVVMAYVARCCQLNWDNMEVQLVTLELPNGFPNTDGISSVVGGFGRVIDFRAGVQLSCEVVRGSSWRR